MGVAEEYPASSGAIGIGLFIKLRKVSGASLNTSSEVAGAAGADKGTELRKEVVDIDGRVVEINDIVGEVDILHGGSGGLRERPPLITIIAFCAGSANENELKVNAGASRGDFWQKTQSW